jgi:hypothetical protein
LRNIDYDVQEVMNGYSIARFLGYRTGWFSLLNQGILRAGTANSDSHTLADERLGYPRTVVFDQGLLAAFESERFNAAVREGRSFGTNGPVLLACIDTDDGCRASSLEAFSPAPDAALRLSITAAPWIPLAELRVFANGALVRVIPIELPSIDPFTRTLGRVETSIPLSELMLEDRDFWIVVEAGLPLPAHHIGDDGLPVVSANGEDGRVPNDDPLFHFRAIAPKTLPLAFTNPFLIDRTGDGWTAPGPP